MEPVSPKKGKILIVDDDESARELLSTILSNEFSGYEIIVAESLAKTKELSLSHNARLFDTAIVDGKLTDGMAWDILDTLEGHGFFGGVIVITGGFHQEIPEGFFDRVDTIFKKANFSFKALFAQARFLIERTQGRRERRG